MSRCPAIEAEEAEFHVKQVMRTASQGGRQTDARRVSVPGDARRVKGVGRQVNLSLFPLTPLLPTVRATRGLPDCELIGPCPPGPTGE